MSFRAYLIPILIAIAIVYDEKAARRTRCLLLDHDYADEHTYRVEPECLACGKRRDAT